MKLKDYLHYYMGCYFIANGMQYKIDRIDRLIKGTRVNPLGREVWNDFEPHKIKLVLRRLEDMTEEEMIGLLQSMVPANIEDKPTDEDYDLEMFYNDDGLMVDADIAVGASFTCICFDGQIGIKKCGSIILFDENKDVTRDQLINTPMAFHYLLTRGFDLFGLIDAGLAIDIKTLTP